MPKIQERGGKWFYGAWDKETKRFYPAIGFSNYNDARMALIDALQEMAQ